VIFFFDLSENQKFKEDQSWYNIRINEIHTTWFCKKQSGKTLKNGEKCMFFVLFLKFYVIR